MAGIGAIPSAPEPTPKKLTRKGAHKERARIDRKRATEIVVEDKSETPNGDMNGINQAAVQAVQVGRHERMRLYFAAQEKETIKIRKELGEQRVQINGYTFQIQAGVHVKVPIDVAETLRDGDIL